MLISSKFFHAYFGATTTMFIDSKNQLIYSELYWNMNKPHSVIFIVGHIWQKYTVCFQKSHLYFAEYLCKLKKVWLECWIFVKWWVRLQPKVCATCLTKVVYFLVPHNKSAAMLINIFFYCEMVWSSRLMEVGATLCICKNTISYLARYSWSALPCSDVFSFRFSESKPFI